MCVWVSGPNLGRPRFPLRDTAGRCRIHSTGTDRHFDQVCFIRVDRKLKSTDVIDVLSDLFILRGVPEHVSFRQWARVRRESCPGLDCSGWRQDGLHRTRLTLEERPHLESFNARLRDELLDGEIFYTLAEARIIIESWRRFYNTLRPHGSLGYKPPAPEVFIPATARAAAQSQPASPPAPAPKPSLH